MGTGIGRTSLSNPVSGAPGGVLDAILTEAGDGLLTEAGDYFLLEQNAPHLARAYAYWRAIDYSTDPVIIGDLYDDNFDDGDIAGWTTAGGSPPAISAEQSWTGLYSVKADTAFNTINQPFTVRDDAYMRCYIRIGAYATANLEIIRPQNGGTVNAVLYVNNSGALSVWNQLLSANYGGGGTLSLNTWYLVEMYWKGTAAGEIRVKVDGTETITQTGLAHGANQVNQWNTGILLGAGSPVVYYDNLGADTSQWLGAALGDSIVDGSGNGHNAQLGSTAGADTNDPLFLDYSTDGEQYLYLTGIAGNYGSTPDAAALDITGDIDIQVRVALDDWTPAALSTLANKWLAAGNHKSWLFGVNTNNKLWWQHSEDGINNKGTQTSDSTPAYADGTLQWVRVTLDVDDGAADGTVAFYEGGTGETPSWSSLGTDKVGSTTSIHSGGADVTIGMGSDGTTGPLTGKVRRVIIKDGIDGTVVLDADFTDTAAVTEPFATFTEGSAQAATVTINRAATGKKSTVVDRDMFLLGTDDYLEVADHADLDFGAAEDLTIIFAGRTYDVSPGALGFLIGKSTGTGTAAGWVLFNNTIGSAQGMIKDGSFNPSDGKGLTNGQAFAATMRRDTVADEIEVLVDGVGSGSPGTDTTTGSLANAGIVSIGAASDGSQMIHGEFHGAAIFRSALSDADIASVGSELLTSVSTVPAAYMGIAIAIGI